MGANANRVVPSEGWGGEGKEGKGGCQGGNQVVTRWEPGMPRWEPGVDKVGIGWCQGGNRGVPRWERGVTRWNGGCQGGKRKMPRWEPGMTVGGQRPRKGGAKPGQQPGRAAHRRIRVLSADEDLRRVLRKAARGGKRRRRVRAAARVHGGKELLHRDGISRGVERWECGKPWTQCEAAQRAYLQCPPPKRQGNAAKKPSARPTACTSRAKGEFARPTQQKSVRAAQAACIRCSGTLSHFLLCTPHNPIRTCATEKASDCCRISLNAKPCPPTLHVQQHLVPTAATNTTPGPVLLHSLCRGPDWQRVEYMSSNVVACLTSSMWVQKRTWSTQCRVFGIATCTGSHSSHCCPHRPEKWKVERVTHVGQIPHPAATHKRPQPRRQQRAVDCCQHACRGALRGVNRGVEVRTCGSTPKSAGCITINVQSRAVSIRAGALGLQPQNIPGSAECVSVDEV
eukprot:138678-Chlamydomonas_euryale.AAC.1